MSRGSQVNAITAPFLALATIVLFLRLYTRFTILKNAGAEDFLVVIAWIFACALSILLANEDTIAILDKHFQEVFATTSADKISEFLKRFFIGIFVYNFSLTCSKLSIALQYRRIFTGGKTNIALWCTISFIIINVIWSFCTNLFFCTPIRKFWKPEVPGSCLNKEGVWFSYAGANILSSSILILLPIPAIVKLQIQWRTKIALVCIFSLGIFDIVLACLRLSSLMNLSQTTDMSWELQPLTIWSSLESTIAIICASLPALRPLVSKAFPKFFSTLSNHSYDLPSLEHQNTRTEFSGNRSSSDFVRVTNQGQMRDAAVDLENGKFDMQAFGAEQSERSSAKDLTLVEACGPLDEKSNAAFRGQSKKSRNLFESEGPNKL